MMDPIASPSPIGLDDSTPTSAPMMLIDMFFPGFSMFSGAVSKYLHIDLNLYIPLVLILGGMTFAWRYFSEYVWLQLESHFMSTVDVRHDDEVYNMLMAWVAAQKFAQGARRFVVNTNLNSRSWFVWDWNNDDDEDDNEDEKTPESKKKALSYTPTFGSHYFWYHGSVLIFRRSQNRDSGSAFASITQREEISVSCFGRNPAVLKELLLEARAMYMKRDERKTLIYRGATRSGSTEPTWQRCMARTARPFSTVILNEKTKQDLIEDVTDYLNPSTRRWYSNRGIPYRRGYLLYGPPGTGKSSLSLALAGFFKMRIYMVSLSSVTANEENLASLFAELPRRCVVLLEDIDTAGLTHTRDDNSAGAVSVPAPTGDADMVPGQLTTGTQPTTSGRLSLSGLLNILDGVASQEGRVLIMTTNHLEKLDKALIRPGRVDMIVEFGRADEGQIASLFRAIFAPLEGDEDPAIALETRLLDAEAAEKKAVEDREKREKTLARVEELAAEFVKAIPAHEFSPAEIQGFLLKNKRNPEGAVSGAPAWVIETRKERKEKELKDAEDKRKADEAKAKADEEAKAKEKEEEDKKAKKAKKEKRKEEKKEKKQQRRRGKASKKAKKAESSDSDSDSGSDDTSDEEELPKKDTAAAKDAAPTTTTEKPTEASAPVVVVAPAPVEAQTEKLAANDKDKDGAKESGDEAKTGRDSGYGTPTAAAAE